MEIVEKLAHDICSSLDPKAAEDCPYLLEDGECRHGGCRYLECAEKLTEKHYYQLPCPLSQMLAEEEALLKENEELIRSLTPGEVVKHVTNQRKELHLLLKQKEKLKEKMAEMEHHIRSLNLTIALLQDERSGIIQGMLDIDREVMISTGDLDVRRKNVELTRRLAEANLTIRELKRRLGNE
jgi:hypothetical protein